MKENRSSILKLVAMVNAMPSGQQLTGLVLHRRSNIGFARVRGADWLYTYLRTFYEDPRLVHLV